MMDGQTVKLQYFKSPLWNKNFINNFSSQLREGKVIKWLLRESLFISIVVRYVSILKQDWNKRNFYINFITLTKTILFSFFDWGIQHEVRFDWVFLVSSSFQINYLFLLIDFDRISRYITINFQLKNVKKILSVLNFTDHFLWKMLHFDGVIK